MKRDYDTGVAEEVVLFTGIEIEKTPAYGMKTLFVVGVQNEQTIINLAKDHNCTHIYFGANQSFPKLNTNDGKGWQPWEDMIQECLDAGFWCTLDFDVGVVEGVGISM